MISRLLARWLQGPESAGLPRATDALAPAATLVQIQDEVVVRALLEEAPPAVDGLVVHRRDDAPAVTAEDPVLATLLNEQAILAQRDNTLTATITSLTSVGAIVVGAIVLQIPDLCRNLRPEALPSNCIRDDQQWIYLAVPLPLFVLLSVVVFLGLNSTITAQLLHKVESALRSKVDFDLPKDETRRETHPIGLPSSSTLTSLLFSSRRARSLWLYQIGAAIGTVLVAALILVTLTVVVGRVDPAWRWRIVMLYAPVAALIVIMFVRANLPNRRLLRDVTEGLQQVQSQDRARSASTNQPVSWRQRWLKRDQHTNRSPLGYLIVPRPIELLLKPAAVWVTLVLVRIVSQQPWPGWRGALVAVAAFEVLLYQARYMFNGTSRFSGV